MYRSPRASALLPLALTSALAAPAVQAQQAEATQAAAGALQEIVVTAQKRTEKLHDVPMGVTAVTTEDLTKQQLVSFADLESKVPGLMVEQIQPGQSRLAIRGQNVGGVGSTVTTYIDDVPFGSSNALANGSIVTGDFDTWDLQRVEVLRGPQGTLYGAGSEGGLLKYVTNAPDPSREAGAFELGGMDLAHGDTGLSTKGMLNMPIGSSAAIRLSGVYAGVPGWVNDPSLGKNYINEGYREGLRADFLFNATDNFSIRLNAFGQNLHTDGTPYTDVIGAAGTPLTPPPNQLQPQNGYYNQTRFTGEPSTFEYRIYSATLDWNLGWGHLASITSYGSSAQNLYVDATSVPLVPGFTFGDLASSVTGVPTGVAETNDLSVGKFTEELRLASSGSQALEWQVGAFYTRELSTLDQSLPTFLIPSQANTGLPGLETVVLDATYKETSVFGEATYHFSPAFDLALGGRWSENKQEASQTIGGLLVNPPQLSSGSSTGTDFTYSIAPRWHISNETMAYARVATGYRPGGPNALAPGTPAGVPTSYESDSTVNYELGTRTALMDNRLSIDIAAFLVDWKKIQLLQIVDNFGVNANGGTAESKGIEWTFGLTPLQGLNFTLTGAWVDAYLTEAAPAAGGNDGDPLPYVPKFSASLDGSYTWRAGGGYDGFVGATWSYIGSRWDDFSATDTVQGGVIVPVPNPRLELPGYNTVNLRAGFENAHWTFLIYCKNVGDTRGITTYASTGTPNNGGSIGLSQPRTLGATITARF
ncbi:MAG TPA: TonB-dependent receptor [Steroidobacteraceae bacterium]|nr:TonB-dependent receptor [Steroidobacteraceae bacterium]